MDQLVKTFALHCGLSLSQYWHLRLVLSVSLGPLLAIGYLIVSGWRKPPRPTYTLWVNHSGQLVARPDKARPLKSPTRARQRSSEL